MMYWALSIVTATSVSVADVYTTREPCERDARLMWQIMDRKPSSVACIPTTEATVEPAEQQLNKIRIFMDPRYRP